MANNDEEDDKPTVVLDLNALKAQAKEEQEQLDELATDLEFNAVKDDAPKTMAEEDKPLVILFDHNSEFFAKNCSKFPPEFEYQVVSDLQSLNTSLQQRGPKAIVFNYNASPKATNQLCAQIKAKFPETRTLIMAKNLSREKAQAHQESKYGAHGYVSAPFKLGTLKRELKGLLESI